MSDVVQRARDLLDGVSGNALLIHLEDATEVVRVVAELADEVDRLRKSHPKELVEDWHGKCKGTES